MLSGMVFSSQAITMMVAAPIWGFIADRYGRKLMIERAMFGGAVILLLMAYAQSAEQLVLIRAIQGLITGTVSAASALIAAMTPKKRLGFAMGVLQVGLGAGIAFGPMIGGAIADAYGYSSAFYVTSVLMVISGLLVLFGIQEDFSRTTKESIGSSFLLDWKEIIKTSGVPAILGMRFISSLGRMIVVPIAPLFVASLMSDQGLLNTMTGLIVGVSAGATTISSYFMGKLGDRTGHRRVLMFSGLISALLYILQSFVVSEWQLLFFQLLTGFFLGGIIPMISALLARYVSSGHEGSVFGLDSSVNSGARALAPLLGGYIASSISLRSAFTAAGIIYILIFIGSIFFIPANGIQTGDKSKKTFETEN